MCATATALPWAESGSAAGAAAAAALPLADLQRAAIALGFSKSGVPDDRPAPQRADMAAFFRACGVSSLTGFKTKFGSTPMAPPSPGDAAPSSAAAALQHQGPYPPLAPSGASAASVDVSRFPELAAALESLKWRAIPRPGGAQMKPADFYLLVALARQATEGDVVGEKPMWAPAGGLDFDGRERWEAWRRLAGMTPEAAKSAFCAAHARALAFADNWRRW